MSLNTRVQLLKRVGLLRLLDEDAIRLIAFNATDRHFAAGNYVFREGSEATGALIIRQGGIDLLSDGDGPQTVYTSLNQFDIVDELALVTPIRRTRAAIARETTEALLVSQTLFRRVLEEYPTATRELHAYLSRRLYHAASDIAKLKPLFGSP